MSERVNQLLAAAEAADEKRRQRSQRAQNLIAAAEAGDAARAAKQPTARMQTAPRAVTPIERTAVFASSPSTQVQEKKPVLERAMQTAKGITLADELRANDEQFVSYATQGEKLYHQRRKDEASARAEMGLLRRKP